jgi:hypothetical protein
MLVKSKKGDTPHPDYDTTYNNYTGRNSNFYMGYSQNKQLDMVDTTRHKIIKTWTRSFRQNSFTTIGADATADGQAVNNAAADIMDGFLVLQAEQARSPAEWEAKIYLEYPDYQMFTKDHLVEDSNFSERVVNAGFDGSKSLLVGRHASVSDSSQEYAVLHDTSSEGYNTMSVETMVKNAPYSATLHYTTGWKQIHEAPAAHQCLIHRKLAAGAPKDDVIQYKHSAIMDIWIPGRLFRTGGRFRFDDNNPNDPSKHRTDGIELEGLYEYNLLFYTFGNFSTWTIPGTVSNTPMMLHLNDFQQIMYYRDP